MMTIEEALQELEIGPESGADEIRRAYLRKLKTRKPEVDPEGFRRLREAYELLTENAEILFRVVTASPPELVVLTPPSQNTPPPLPPSPIEDVRRRLAAIDHSDERLAVLRRAVREHPGEASLRWWLLRELEDWGLEEEAVELLCRSDQEGLEGFFEHLAGQYPDALTEKDLERLVESGEPENLTIAAEAWLFRGAPERAVETLFRAMAIADEADDPATPEPGRIVAFLLRLQGEGDREEAERLQERFHERLRGAGREVDLLDPQSAALLQIAQEIALLSPRFPAEIRTAITRAVANGSPEQAVPVLRWLIQSDPRAAWQAASEIRQQPTLEEMYGELFMVLPLPVAQAQGAGFQPPEPETWTLTRTFFIGCFLPAGIVGVLLVVMAYFAAPPPPPELARGVQGSWSAQSGLPPTLQFASVDEAMQAVCGNGNEGPVLPEVIEICGAARETVAHLRQPDCYQALRASWRLRAAINKAPSPLMHALLQIIKTEAAPVCNML
jgi:hypothetical protein